MERYVAILKTCIVVLVPRSKNLASGHSMIFTATNCNMLDVTASQNGKNAEKNKYKRKREVAKMAI